MFALVFFGVVSVKDDVGALGPKHHFGTVLGSFTSHLLADLEVALGIGLGSHLSDGDLHFERDEGKRMYW